MRKYIITILFAAALMLFITPNEAHALSFGYDFKCIDKGSGKYTQTVIDCINTPVREASLNILKKLSDYFKPVVLALNALAIALFGINMIGMGGRIAAPSFGFILRFGIVSVFSYNMAGLGGYMFKIMDQLLLIVTPSGYSAWAEIDKILGKLIGFASDPDFSEVKDGILGMVAGSWTYKFAGGMLTVIGLITLWMVLGFIFESVFLYIISVIVLAFLIVISPFIIPFAVFRYGEEYVTKLFKVMVAAMLAPAIAFAIIWMFVGTVSGSDKGIFPQLVDDVFAVMDKYGIDHKTYMTDYLHENQPHNSVSHTVDSDTRKRVRDQKCKGDTTGKCNPNEVVAVANPVYSNDASAQNSKFKTQQLDLGEKDTQIKRELFVALLNLAIFGFIMQQMMRSVQSVASAVADAHEYRGVSEETGSPRAGIGITPRMG